MMDYRQELFRTYAETHSDRLESDLKERQAWMDRYVHSHYLPRLQSYNPATTRLLEIGSGKGLLADSLRRVGWRHVTGLDLSPVDVAFAATYVPAATFHCVDAVTFLRSQPQPYDVVVMKAVLEHVEKPAVLPMLRAISQGLSAQGALLVDVPNMDWLFAPHERYMDYTHESGFTQDSLRQVLRQSFRDVTIFPIDQFETTSWLEALKKRLARLLVHRLILWADQQAAALPLWARGLVAIAKSPCSGEADHPSGTP